MPFRHSAESDRVRRYSTTAQRRKIDNTTVDNVRRFAAQSSLVIDRRIQQLRREWSIERFLQLNTAGVGLATALFAVTKDRRWSYATCAALAFLLVHALEGFDPRIPILRQWGIRSRSEIDHEIYALKVARGDFDEVDLNAPASEAAERVSIAVGL